MSLSDNRQQQTTSPPATMPPNMPMAIPVAAQRRASIHALTGLSSLSTTHARPDSLSSQGGGGGNSSGFSPTTPTSAGPFFMNSLPKSPPVSAGGQRSRHVSFSHQAPGGGGGGGAAGAGGGVFPPTSPFRRLSYSFGSPPPHIPPSSPTGTHHHLPVGGGDPATAATSVGGFSSSVGGGIFGSLGKAANASIAAQQQPQTHMAYQQHLSPYDSTMNSHGQGSNGQPHYNIVGEEASRSIPRQSPPVNNGGVSTRHPSIPEVEYNPASHFQPLPPSTPRVHRASSASAPAPTGSAAAPEAASLRPHETDRVDKLRRTKTTPIRPESPMANMILSGQFLD
ncbi:hypothetical protein H4R33_001183 [Dimargaris cristalligena]|uniref:Uncharacterized protein n=1 Tax=Dimargaris cristalligena TaxID=215637 RepID=A0A4P9ZPT2_9FUNG|nr:hypothetical protein H4R33_001183 [Dimargaris cristalligena]RKP34612.1 hypothetical protein BJ085DRAFT_36480 [Dimargaris cristalligena]|eukprot:RKP34612.1 hypothetical protein BJ085DRAFT_36480 [Dimargaris cristalligena]